MNSWLKVEPVYLAYLPVYANETDPKIYIINRGMLQYYIMNQDVHVSAKM